MSRVFALQIQLLSTGGLVFESDGNGHPLRSMFHVPLKFGIHTVEAGL